jgi:DUF4097 and DUF4098 domain-containing protein YvlB
MSRPLVLLLAALALAAPTPGLAQSTAEQAQERAEREQERVERARELERERRERERERAQERAEQLREQAEERRERERERDQERRERLRESASVLDTTVTFDARGTVTVSCPGGDVVVTGTDRNQIVVKARTERGGIRFVSSGTTATLEPATSRGCSDANFELSVPRGVRLLAGTWSGSLTVRGVHGDVEAHAQSGDIDVSDAGGNLEVESLSGDITVEGVRGAAIIHSLSGDVTLNRTRGDVEVETVSGNIGLLDVVTKQLRAHSTSGDLEFAGTIVSAGRYEFNTHSGEIRLALPANVGAQLSLSTFSGEIDSAFPITLTPGAHGIGASQAKKLNFSLGQGSARIMAETFSGDVTLSATGQRR